MLDFDRIEKTPVVTSPFSFFMTESALGNAALAEVGHDFPAIEAPGVFPLPDLDYGPAFQALADDIRSDRMREIIEKKFGLDLENKPLMITVRGRCRLRDGKIHTDSLDKLVTVLLYLNDNWNAEGGRLRLLRNDHDLNDYIAEVPPNGGTLLAFKRSDNSWHGHEPFEGKRRCIMFNWVQNPRTLEKNLLRHRLSAQVKKFLSLFRKNQNDY
jgi:SM-20-related protein